MEDNKKLHEQLIKLGDMMGDGLHHEDGGKWIEREYKKISNILFGNNPEYKKIKSDHRKRANEITDKLMASVVEKFKCMKCEGPLKQVRSGSKISVCTNCGTRHKIKKKK